MAARVSSVLNVPRGEDYTKSWRWKVWSEDDNEHVPVNLTGWTGVCQVRGTPNPTGYLLVADIPVTLGGADGTVTLTVPGNVSWAWVWKQGFFDVVLKDAAEVPIRFAEGMILPDGGVSDAA